jgi:signal transduction histidine kinase/integral membrane sensor domain MASE1/ActR/RegA family two-component response regulator
VHYTLDRVRRESVRLVCLGVAVSLAYVLAARAGFLVAFSAEQITTVWAPTGIAQAALLLWGRVLWPAVWLGAFAANGLSDAPAWTAVIIATGNTLEAVALATVLPRAVFNPGLARLSDAVRLIVMGGGVTPVISATVGVTALCASGELAWANFAALWWQWWLGDALGSIVVAPVILTVARSTQQRGRGRWRVSVVMIMATLVITALIFSEVLGASLGRGPLHYVLFPLVIAAAVRYGQPCTSLVVFTASILTILYTVRGVGPFASSDLSGSLILLQTFMGVLAGTGLLLASALVERKTIQRRVTAVHAVGEALAGAADLNGAAPVILRGICESLRWQYGAIWLVDENSNALRLLATWPSSRQAPIESFQRVTEQSTFARGVGLPGRVWANGVAAWIEDAVRDRNFPRAAAAAAAGLHGAFAFPIKIDGETVGVIEFFTFSVLSRDGELLEAMATIGAHVGQFIERKRIEVSIRQSEARFRTLAASANALTLYEQDHELRYRWIFPDHPEFFEHTIGHTDAELMPTKEGERLTALKRRVIESGIGVREEVAVTLPDGPRSYDLMIEPRRNAAGEIVGVAGVSVDITERKRQEQLLRDSQQQLRDADRRKDEFLAMLAHELRNPLAPIRTGLEFLRVSGNDAAAVERVRPMMERQVNHMVRLIDDLLDVSRITSGKIHLQKERAYLAEMIHAAVDANRIAIESGGAHLVIDLPADPVPLLVDPTRFVQVVSNLLHNAAKFTGPGGTITVAGRIIEGGMHGTLVVTVADTGAGISADLLPRVFDLFTQGRPPEGRGPSGLGIGLALARRLLEMHGGTIDAHSDGPGQGSEFTLRLPMVTPQPARVDQRPAPPQSLRLAIDRRVLIVDDNADSADALAWLVRAIGGDPRTTYDGPTAVREAAAFAPHIVLLDIGMAGMDGYETCRRIRETAAPQPFIIAITGWGQDRDKVRAAEAGFDAHITKPADPAILEQLLANAAAGITKS